MHPRPARVAYVKHLQHQSGCAGTRVPTHDLLRTKSGTCNSPTLQRHRETTSHRLCAGCEIRTRGLRKRKPARQPAETVDPQPQSAAAAAAAPATVAMRCVGFELKSSSKISQKAKHTNVRIVRQVASCAQIPAIIAVSHIVYSATAKFKVLYKREKQSPVYKSSVNEVNELTTLGPARRHAREH